MDGQVFTIAKLHYLNGVVYRIAQNGVSDVSDLAGHAAETTKSGECNLPGTPFVRCQGMFFSCALR